ncbi:glyoxylate/hydroxypyruvate reductase B-like [Oenanthe melanoleuca]|uniref:glyoxylate/hydroxypyruvate reductase B-like n=1 Tax=Oenanthe melanoleuca TaxID=2939378 RepID=UPI0024C169B3|nr:glyoxylate/hydroxypyruvate reductase B-like [Oenanthe melanoleuca]
MAGTGISALPAARGGAGRGGRHSRREESPAGSRVPPAGVTFRRLDKTSDNWIIMFRRRGSCMLRILTLMLGQSNLPYRFNRPVASHRRCCHRSLLSKQRYRTLAYAERQAITAGTKVMAEGELPAVLILDIGGTHGVLEDLVALLKKHFQLITMKEFLANKEEVSKKIQSVFVFERRPTIDRELLESLPNLKVIGNSGVGVDHLDLKMISSFGVKVTNTPHAVADPTADIGMALMLASARRLVEGCQIAVSPDTKSFAVDWLGVEVSRATLGIIGMGSIGYKVAQRARAFNMRILYHNRNRRRKEEEEAVGAHYCAKMKDLLQQSDFVMLVVNLTPETHKLIGKKELELMKPTATLINISRVHNISISPSMEKYCEVDILGVKVTGATLGIIGMGSIGYKIALRAKAFEMNILYHNRTRRKVPEEQAVGATYCKKIDSLLQQADFVMLVVSLTPQTHKLIGKRELELMKPTATLVNISRGAVVDQEALLAALQTGVIRAAALDVTSPEPLPRDHPLLKLKNVIITPHLGIKTDKATYRITEEAVENILAALNGLPLPSEVLPS